MVAAQSVHQVALNVSVEPFHLFRYLDEQAFRYNQRKNSDGTVRTDGKQFDDVLGAIAGKRLTYDTLTGNATEEGAKVQP